MDRPDLDGPTAIKDIHLPAPSITPESERAHTATSIHARFVECAASNPVGDAVLSAHGRWSYFRLAGAVDKLSTALSKIGVGAGSKVAVHLERGPWLVAALLAASKLDAVFAIYDVEYPQARIELMDSIFGAAVWISAAHGENTVEVELEGRSIHLRTGGAHLGTARPPPEARYALFTSGTTGRPKCVLASANGLLTFLASHIKRTGASAEVRFALTGGLGHDPVLRDIFTPILSGGVLAVPPKDFRENPRCFSRWLRDVRINVLHLTPQISKLIALGAEGQAFPDLRHVIWGGDMLQAKDAAAFLALAPNAQGWNLYGTTETPQAAALFRITPPLDWTICPIGRGVNGRKVEIAQNGRMAGYGEVGEIIVEATDLSLGYYASEGLSLLPGRRETTAVRYETGDLGFFLPSGDIAIVGRSDDQLKVRGYRVERSELVRVLEQQPGVAHAAVLCEIGANGENELIGYVTGSSEDLAGDRILAACRRTLPSQMVPREIIVLSQLPLTPNGKLDRDRLPRSSLRPAAPSAAEAPQTEIERQVVGAVAKTLDRTSVPPTASVRDLGVDSLSFLSVSLALEQIIGDLPTRWDEISLRDLAASETRRGYFPPVETPVLIRAIAIAGVVATHFHLIGFVGTTSALFFVAGHSFGRFQATVSAERDSVAPILKVMGQIALPTLLYTFLTQAVFHELTPATWFFASNFIGTDVAGGFSFWFIEVLLQNLAILAALFALPGMRRLVRERPFETAVAFTMLAYLVHAGVGTVWHTGALDHRVPHEKIWLMGLGWGVAASVTWRQRALVVALAVILLGLELVVGGETNPLMFATVPVILAFRRVRLPYPLNVGVTMVAAASLFIYLTHFQFLSLVHKLPDVMTNEWMSLMAALLGGVLVHLSWERFLRIARSLSLSGLRIHSQWRRLASGGE